MLRHVDREFVVVSQSSDGRILFKIRPKVIDLTQAKNISSPLRSSVERGIPIPLIPEKCFVVNGDLYVDLELI